MATAKFAECPSDFLPGADWKNIVISAPVIHEHLTILVFVVFCLECIRETDFRHRRLMKIPHFAL
jgi:hypothetical protein